jgi:hypothetical protein
LKKLETKQTKTLFFTAVEIVPTRLRRILGWVPFGVKSILCLVPF